MNQKGQIFTLDFLISMVLVILALGLVIQFLELNEYNLQEQELRHELETVGSMAADLMVSSPEIVCELGYYENPMDMGSWYRISYLMNCLTHTATEKVTISKSNLKLPEGYSCKISFDPASGLFLSLVDPEDACDDDPSNAKNTYSVTRAFVSPSPIAVMQPQRIGKQYFGTSNFGVNAKVTLTVWKED